MQKSLIIFVRKPEAGKVKTRLASQVGNEKALEVYIKLLQHTQQICHNVNADKYLFGTELEDDVSWDGFFQARQRGDDLGNRMMNAFNYLFEKNYEKVVIIGSDCPLLTAEIIEEAFNKLDETDIVIGPAEDGGYYLLGMKKLVPALFRNIQWSSATVFSDTIRILQSLSLTYFLLPELSDIDTEEDWLKYEKRISV